LAFITRAFYTFVVGVMFPRIVCVKQRQANEKINSKHCLQTTKLSFIGKDRSDTRTLNSTTNKGLTLWNKSYPIPKYMKLWSVTRRSSLAKGNTIRHCSVPLDLTSVSG